jgi:malic enzyme
VRLPDGQRVEIGQANNVFVFPGVGLGAIVAEAATVTDRMFLLAGETLAAAVTDDRLATGALYPPVTALRDVSRAIAVAVALEAGTLDDPEAAVDAAMWWPDYVPYLPARPVERRRSTET